MSKYQLWSRDEYGQGSIIFNSDNLDDVISRGREEVTKINVSNALTADDRERNWEAYMIDIVSEDEDIKYVYGGPHSQATDTIYVFNGDEESVVKLSEVPDPVVNIYLGNISNDRKKEKDWLATDASKKGINSVSHQDLSGKTMFFVKKV